MRLSNLHKTALCLCALGALTFGLVLSVQKVQADTPAPIYIPVALTPVQRTSPIELVALTLDVDITEVDGHTVVAGNSTFKLHNTDLVTDLAVPVGFPAWAGDPYVFDPGRLDTFTVTLDGRKLSLTPSRAEAKVGNTVRTVDWYTFTLSIAADEKRIVRFDFQEDLGDGAMPRFVYGLTPATNWKNSVGSARFTLNFPKNTSLDQVVATNPSNPTFDGTSLNWLFLNHNPVSNPSVTFLKPSTWNDLMARRRNVEQNPNDPNAHATLGSLLRQLETLDSARSDSYYMQALAEFEIAARLDPKNRASRQALAALYESRAGPPAGPRQATYVSLAAAQWEALAPTDPAARKQLAEDYFFLGQNSQAQGDYGEALGYLDKAASLAPGGAGPLFTPERATAQRRSLNIAWARSLLEKGNIVSAMEKARSALGDSFMASSQVPSFITSRAQVTTSAQSRELVLRIIPLGKSPEEVQNDLKEVAKALQGAGAQVNIETATDNAELLLTVRVLFDDQTAQVAQLTSRAKVIPGRAEWSLLQVLLSPKSLSSTEQDQLWSLITDYHEEIDLSRACAPLNAQLNALKTNLGRYQNVAQSDGEGQLKRALLQIAQSGWQRALSDGSVAFHAGGKQVRVDACAARTLGWTSSSPRLAALAVVAGGLVAITGVTGVWLISRKRGGRPSSSQVRRKHGRPAP